MCVCVCVCVCVCACVGLSSRPLPRIYAPAALGIFAHDLVAVSSDDRQNINRFFSIHRGAGLRGEHSHCLAGGRIYARHPRSPGSNRWSRAEGTVENKGILVCLFVFFKSIIVRLGVQNPT